MYILFMIQSTDHDTLPELLYTCTQWAKLPQKLPDKIRQRKEKKIVKYAL